MCCVLWLFFGNCCLFFHCSLYSAENHMHRLGYHMLDFKKVRNLGRCFGLNATKRSRPIKFQFTSSNACFQVIFKPSFWSRRSAKSDPPENGGDLESLCAVVVFVFACSWHAALAESHPLLKNTAALASLTFKSMTRGKRDSWKRWCAR